VVQRSNDVNHAHLIQFQLVWGVDLRQLRYFIIAAEEENFHRASERLHVAQPALSRHIAALEAELGCALFTRFKKRVHLAPAGRSLLEDGVRILRAVESAQDRARRASEGQSGTLRIGFHETAGRSKIVNASFREFRSRYPEVELRLSQSTSPAQCAQLRDDQLDAGFIYLSPESAEFASQGVSLHRFFLAVGVDNPIARRPKLYLRDLAEEQFIWLARERNPFYSKQLLRHCLAGGLVPKIVQEADNEAMTLNLVAAGMGVAFAVSETAEPFLPDIVFRSVADLDAGMQLALAWRKEPASEVLGNFSSVVRACAAQIKEAARSRPPVKRS